jgi:hypothetical protein
MSFAAEIRMTAFHKTALALSLGLLVALPAHPQYMQKILLNTGDSTDYYLAIPPMFGNAAGALIVLVPFGGPETMIPVTRLHNLASGNSLLTVYASMGKHLLPDQETLYWVGDLLVKVSATWHIDITEFALGGSDLAGTVVLRYAEVAQEHPDQYPINPKAVFSNSGYVDLASFYHRCERQIRKNFYPPTVGDARIYLDILNKQIGSPETNPDRYREFSPFHTADTAAGNERWLQHVALRLYYDADIEYQLSTRRNSYYDTDLPDASELIDRLMLSGDKKAEFIAAKHPAFRTNGQRSPSAFSILDETDCIQWIKRVLNILDPNDPMGFVAPYHFQAPDNWPIERSSLPPRWAPDWTLKGIEEIRFAPGWGKHGEPDYWSLAYLFWLDKGQKVDANDIQTQLYNYFDGLIKSNGASGQRNIPKDKIVPTSVNMHLAKTEPDDTETYTGTIDMLDYQALVPFRLNIMAHIKNCPGQHHTALFIEASPKPFTDPLWQQLKAPKTHFACEELH